MSTDERHHDPRSRASPIAGRASTSRPSSKQFEERGAQAPRPRRPSVEHWVDDMVEPEFTKRERAHTHAPRRRPDRWRTTSSSRARSAGIGYKVQALDMPDNDALQFGKEFGNRGQCNPTYFTVGNLVKYLDRPARRAGHDDRGHRQELRVPHRRRVRPVPLRHVRHRVPQGAPRRRLRRLPRHAVPAEGRPQAGDRRGASASR